MERIYGYRLLLASCATSTHFEKDDTANFNEYKTFAWLEKNPNGEKDKNRQSDLTEQHIREAVNKELTKSAGWKEVKNRPDVFLSYDVLVEEVQQKVQVLFIQGLFQECFTTEVQVDISPYFILLSFKVMKEMKDQSVKAR